MVSLICRIKKLKKKTSEYNKKGASQVALVAKNPPADAGDAGSIPRSGRSSGGVYGNPHPVFLPGKPHGQWNLVGYSP